MKTIKPNDYSKVLDDHLKASYMGKDAQKKYLRTAIAYLVIFGFLIWIAGWCMAELWDIYLESQK